jgi:hypothetical protein
MILSKNSLLNFTVPLHPVSQLKESLLLFHGIEIPFLHTHQWSETLSACIRRMVVDQEPYEIGLQGVA